jgi:hypothetical protein
MFALATPVATPHEVCQNRHGYCVSHLVGVRGLPPPVGRCASDSGHLRAGARLVGYSRSYDTDVAVCVRRYDMDVMRMVLRSACAQRDTRLARA